ncbi:MAG: PD-(D/E)XK nuclease family protein, partial [Planctomycetota bacterium]
GLSRQMAQTIAELHLYAKTPDDIRQLLSELAKDERNSLSRLKFTDIGLIFEEYIEFLEGKFIDPDAQLTRACKAVSAASFAGGAKLWVDGFAGFTTAELAILAELLKVVADAQIALCLDPSGIDLANPDLEKLDPTGLFAPTEQTYYSLFDVIRKSKLKAARPVVLEEAVRFSNCPALAHVERDLFTLEPSKLDAADNIRIVSAPNARAEVQFVTKQILEMVRQKDCRYRDIAVIASDIESYQHYIRACFEDYDIPFFIDKRRPLNHHPAVQLVSSALRAVTGGFSSGDIFAYLKTDLVPVERCDIDQLENYCLAFGISARDWQSDRPWRFAGPDNERFDERRIDEIRIMASRPLLDLQDRLCPTGEPAGTFRAQEFTQAIFHLLCALKVTETIGRWIEEADETGDSAATNEHRQFYDKFVDIFDELIEVFAGRTMTAEDYLAIISSAFSQLTLAFIPPTLDQVLVGSIERSRHPDLKAVFLIGATQRQFPVPISSDSILNDDDRSAAGAADFPLAANTSQTLAERQYLAYIAFTRPSEFLCITYPAVDDRGSDVPRSQFVGELESLFENLRAESVASRQRDIAEVCSQRELTDLLCSALGKDAFAPQAAGSARLSGLLDEICSDEQLAESGSDVLYAIDYDNSSQLDADVVEKLFGRQIKSSATRLSTFAACPYQYFARYTLGLKEREEFKFEPLDLGAFYHRILDAWLKRLNAEEKDVATADDRELSALLRDEIEKLIREDSFISNFVSRRGYNEFVIHSAGEVLHDCILAVARMVRAGSFRPVLSEISFGQARNAHDTFGRYELALSGGRVLSLDGKIDRLDVADVDGRKLGIVFDYKRRDTSFSWPKLSHGLDIQLPIYMLAVRNAAGATVADVAGAFYMPIEVSPAKTTLGKLSEKADSFDYKARGVFNGELARQLDSAADSGWSRFFNFSISAKDEQYGNYGISGALRTDDFERLLKFTEQKIIQSAEEIVSGEIDVRPYRLNQLSPCSYCRYRPVCRFDWQINDYNFLESVNKVQVLEKMGAVDGR